MRFSLLGELEVESAGRVIRLRGRRLRSLLACLLVNRNQTVSPDRLVEAVWGARPPPSGTHGLEALVSRLRRRLGPEAGSRIETTPGGYRLHVAAEELDVDRFERRLAAARRALTDGADEAAIEHSRKGLEEWSGEAFGDLLYEPWYAEEARRLEELRLDAFEALFEAELRCGKLQDSVSEIEGFVAANPLREHARAQLMRVLYRCGRQADALDVYRAGYRALAEQGLEPGVELRHVQTLILQHDRRLKADHAAADLPATHYARSDGVAIAYQVLGEGPYDIVFLAPFVTNVELAWQVPGLAELLNRLGSVGRLIRLDKRGTGMSDWVPVGELGSGVDDVRAVMDAALSKEAAIVGASQGGPLAAVLAATHPERVWALVLWCATPRVAWAEDNPSGTSEAELERRMAEDERIWTEPGYAETRARAVGAGDVSELAALWRQSATPGVVRALAQRYFDVDVRDVLPRIRAPTLVLDDGGEIGVTSGCRYFSEHIADARRVVVPGSDSVMFGGGTSETVVREIKTFLDAAWTRHTADLARAASMPRTS